MRAGQLRERITIERRTEQQSDTGEVTWTWQPAVTCRARISAKGGQEEFVADQVSPRRVVDVYIRYRTDLADAEQLRIRHGQQIYDVVFASNLNERNRELHLQCVQRLAQGWRSG